MTNPGRIEKFEDLIAWQKARELTKNIYQVTKQGDFLKVRCRVDQAKRIHLSILLLNNNFDMICLTWEVINIKI